MMQAALLFIRALPIWQQLAGAAIALALAGGAIGISYAVWHHKVFREGYDKAIADIATQDQEAVDAVAQALSRVRDCRSAGRVWSQASGQCQGR